ncbi:RHS repeat-associated protein [Pseudomonas sp. EB276 TE3739]|uniref:RHS repeat domain-containing protein n=1 Tax=Pseudomonas TaxID=286 RepID=UPI00209E6EE6|nr:RHS repeat-associated core domain-containing protein [Pseudomonas koreensis]MCP1473852.1 insecticidal toxin complex protein TccC [Pseudomonas koreensis]
MNVHHDTATPTLSVIDPRLLAIRSVGYCRHPDAPAIESRITRQIFDEAGRQVASWDQRLYGVAPKPNLATLYALSGQELLTDSVDAGWQVRLLNEAGSMCSGWDARGSQSHRQYDDLQRPLALTEQAQDGQSRVVERWIYGKATDDRALHNQCGRPIRHDDPAGNRHFDDYGLGGAVVVESRRFLIELETPDWPLDPDRRDACLEETTYVTRQTFTPTGDLQHHIDAVGNLRTQHYNVAGQSCATWLVQAGEGRQPKCLVSAIRYNAQGQIESETAGNGVIARAEYSRDDGRLLRLLASVGAQKPLQDLNYIYDPVGNIVSLEDKTQVVSWFNNQRIDPVRRYRYDSLYQLVEASGWEVSQPSHGPALPDLLPTPLDPNQRRNYTQKFNYDAAGNLITRQHSGAPGFSMYTSTYSNRSLAERDDGSLPGEPEIALGFDAAGNQLELQRGQAMSWNIRNELSRVVQVRRQNDSDDYECYRYDEPGHRLRKTTVSQATGQTLTAEVRYLPGLEIHREGNGVERHVISVDAARNQVRVLHWPSGAEGDQLRYGLSDHLGSSTLELDDGAGILTQEHYYPFGGTACWAGKNSLVAKNKTIRYSGKERDVTGLYYYGYRYYASWLQRWTSPDPGRDIDGVNLYAMLGNSPLIFVDKQGMVRGLSSILSGASDAEHARKSHFELHLLPRIMARKDSDKSFAIVKIKRMARIQSDVAADELLQAAVDVISRAKLTFNINPESIPELKGDGLRNIWHQGVKPGFASEFRDGFEMDMFDYVHSPSKIIKEYGSVDHPKFSGDFRPVYGALKLSAGLASAGGASAYGSAAFHLKDESRKYMTLIGADSFDLKPSINNLASFGNLYPVFHEMQRETWQVLTRIMSGAETDLASPDEYVEWQSHNSVKWKDMTSLVFQRREDMENIIDQGNTRAFLKKNSITPSYVG